MGQHTLHRAGGISTSTGRAIFTGAAALALLTGGTGMAFAGESSHSSSDDHEDAHEDAHEKDAHDSDDDSDDSGHDTKHDGYGKHDGHGKHERPVKAECEFFTTPAVEYVDALDEDLTNSATVKDLNDASTELSKPVEDELCKPVSEALNTVDHELGGGHGDDDAAVGETPTGL